MSDTGILSKFSEAGKSLVKGTAQEVTQSVAQGVSQITGDQKSPQEIAQEVTQLRQQENQETPLKISNIENQIRMERYNREQRYNPPPITQDAKPAMVNLGELVRKKRDNKESKIAAA